MLSLQRNADTCACVLPVVYHRKGAHDLDKEMLTEKLIKNYPFDYTALLEAAAEQSEQIS